MTIRRLGAIRWFGVLLLAGWAAAQASGQAAAPAREFSVLHISDIHVEPHLARTPPPKTVQGQETIRWLCEQAGQPQEITPLKLTLPPPAFALATGDLTEYGVIDDTFDIFEQAFKPLPCPLHLMPGNHDNTWVASYAVMRKRHGGENHSFDQSGCHFVCLSSASPQEPVPSLDAKTRTWLKADLDKLAAGTPVFMAMHHPSLTSDEFANPAELDTFVDLLRDYNVVLLLYGHGHSVEARDIGGLPGVMGGSTWGKNAGYGLLSVRGDDVRYAYRYHHDPAVKEGAGETAWKSVWSGTIAGKPQPRLFEIAQPAETSAPVTDKLSVKLTMRGRSPAEAKLAFAFRIDGKEVATADSAKAEGGMELSLADPTPGAHLLSVTARGPDVADVRTRSFQVGGTGIDVVWRKQLPNAVKAAPVVVDKSLIVAGNDGVVAALDKRDGTARWTFATGAEILGPPAWSDATLVVGSGDGKIYALDDGGKKRWTFDAGLPVYGWPLIVDSTVYVGDNGGRMYALGLADGALRWKFERADYSIECQPATWNDLVIFGAWDGYLYALQRDDGALRWKSLGPKSSEGGAARYYAPADCGPLPRGETLFVCDRGYQLGTFSADGKPGTKYPLKAAAIAPAADGHAVYVRTIDDHVAKLSTNGEVVWQADVPAGRFPIPPTEHDGRVYVCSNRGRLSVLDARDGKTIWTYQATPGFYVMAPVTVDSSPAGDSPVCYIAGMDGSLTAVRQTVAPTSR